MYPPQSHDRGKCDCRSHDVSRQCGCGSHDVSRRCEHRSHQCNGQCDCKEQSPCPTSGKDLFKKAVKFVAKWLVEWNEFWGIPLGLLLFALSPRLLSWIEPTAGSYDIVILQPLLYSVAALWFLKGMCWLLLRFDFPVVYRWLDNKLGEEFAQLPKAYKMLFAAGMFSFYLTLLVVLTVILL